MLLESLNALVLAGDDALQTTCGMTVEGHGISLVRQGSLTFPALAELRMKAAPLQQIHLGCDALLCGQLPALVEPVDGRNGIEALTYSFLKQLLSELDGRNPRGTVQCLDVGPVNLLSRGVRSFGIRFETVAGQFFVLAEVPSRIEMEIAKGSDYLRAMESTYLPRDWANRQSIDSSMAIDNFLVFLRKIEGDVAIEVPGADEASFVHNGVLLDNGTIGGVRGLKFCTDLSEAMQDGLKIGDTVRATVGVEERSLHFTMNYLGPASHALAAGAELPCAFFSPPEKVTISQRRLAFRIPVSDDIQVTVHGGFDTSDPSPWGDAEVVDEDLFTGSLADLSFGGARIVAEDSQAVPQLEIDRTVICDITFPDLDEPVSVTSIVRRASSRLIDRNIRVHELGLEFVIHGDADRYALEHVRQFVLAEQRSRLSQRIHVTGITN